MFEKIRNGSEPSVGLSIESTFPSCRWTSKKQKLFMILVVRRNQRTYSPFDRICVPLSNPCSFIILIASSLGVPGGIQRLIVRCALSGLLVDKHPLETRTNKRSANLAIVFITASGLTFRMSYSRHPKALGSPPTTVAAVSSMRLVKRGVHNTIQHPDYLEANRKNIEARGAGRRAS